MVNVADYGGSNGVPVTFVADRTTANFYLGVCNGHSSDALDGTVTVAYTFM